MAEIPVQDVMESAAAVVSWIESADSAMARMRELGWKRLPVVDAHGVIGLCELGMLQASERRGNWMGGISVGDMMRRGPFWCRLVESSDKALKIMDRLHTDVLAVIDHRGRVVGTVHRDRLKPVAENTH
jgi:CBS domain-containing protein